MWPALTAVVFPRRCLLCGALAAYPFCRPTAPSAFYPYLCHDCAPAVAALRLPAVPADEPALAGGVFSGFRYADGLASLIHSWKYGRRQEVTPLMRRLVDQVCLPLATALATVDVVAAVPLSPRDWRRRGFNQAAVIAAAVAARLDKKPARGLLVKVRQTARQAALSREERQRNLAAAFRVDKPALVAGKTVLVCDDVLTTGTTLGLLADLLLAAGAGEVKGFTLARTMKKGTPMSGEGRDGVSGTVAAGTAVR